jgi:hypothetical protein
VWTACQIISSTSVTRGGPVLVAFGVAGLTGLAGILAEGCVEDRDGLGERDRQVEEERALAGLLGGFDPQFAFAVGGGVRFGGEQPRVHVRDLPAAVRRPTERGAVGSLTLAEEQVIGFALDLLAVLEAESPGAGAPPAAGPGRGRPVSR